MKNTGLRPILSDGGFSLKRFVAMKRKIINWLIKPATLAFIKQGVQTEDYTVFDFIHGYVYTRWPYLYISVGVGEHPLTKFLSPFLKQISDLFLPRNPLKPNSSPDHPPQEMTFADTYHGKVMPLSTAPTLVNVKEEIRMTNLEKVIPYQRARDIILKNPDHIAVLECPCRAAREEPCTPLEVCLIIDEPFASFVRQLHPARSRWITQEQQLQMA